MAKPVIFTFSCGTAYDKIAEVQPGTHYVQMRLEVEPLETLMSLLASEDPTESWDMVEGEKKEKSWVALVCAALAEDPRLLQLCFLCSSQMSTGSFGDATITALIFRVVRALADRGGFIEFGDFSLKALLMSWNVDVMGGLAPFVLLAPTSGHQQVKSSMALAAKGGNDALQVLVRVSNTDADGVATFGVHTMNGTVVIDHIPAELASGRDILHATVASTWTPTGRPTPCHAFVAVGDAKGGLYISCSHWCELKEGNINHAKLEVEVNARLGPGAYSARLGNLTGVAREQEAVRIMSDLSCTRGDAAPPTAPPAATAADGGGGGDEVEVPPAVVLIPLTTKLIEKGYDPTSVFTALTGKFVRKTVVEEPRSVYIFDKATNVPGHGRCVGMQQFNGSSRIRWIVQRDDNTFAATDVALQAPPFELDQAAVMQMLLIK